MTTSGSVYTFIGTGFVPGEQVVGQILSDTVNLPVQTADQAGRVVFTWTPPAGFAPGTHEIVLTALSGSVSQTFTVSAPASTPSGLTAPTGGTSIPNHSWIPIAVFLLVLIPVTLFLRHRTSN